MAIEDPAVHHKIQVHLRTLKGHIGHRSQITARLWPMQKSVQTLVGFYERFLTVIPTLLLQKVPPQMPSSSV